MRMMHLPILRTGSMPYIDRGGLVRVSENTCLLFHSIEQVVRSMYNRATMETMTDGIKQRLRQ